MKLVDRLGQEITAGCIVMQVLSGNTFAVKEEQHYVDVYLSIAKLDCDHSLWTRDLITVDQQTWAKRTEVIG